MHLILLRLRAGVLRIRTVLEVLKEVADVAADLVPGAERKGDDGDEAEGEPFPARCC